MTERLHFHFSLSCIGEGNGNSLQCSCLENPRDNGAWWAAVCGAAQSQTRLKQLSSSSSMFIELRMPSNHLILSPTSPTLNLYQPGVCSTESALHIRWPKYWSFNFGLQLIWDNFLIRCAVRSMFIFLSLYIQWCFNLTCWNITLSPLNCLCKKICDNFCMGLFLDFLIFSIDLSVSLFSNSGPILITEDL